MSERAELWAAAAAAVEAERPGAMATVARRRGSLPMATDAKMLVTADGGRWGTVGGGCTEADVTAQALATLETGAPTTVRHSLNADVAGDVGLSCGGTVELFVEPLAPSVESARLCRAVSEAIAARRPAVVLTPVDWSGGPRKLAAAGDRVWRVGGCDLTPPPADAGHGWRGPAALDDAGRVFIEPVPRVPRLVVFGAGHVGAEIARAAARCDFHVVVVDDRAEFADPARLPGVAEVLAEDFRLVLDRLVFDADDYVIAATRGHSYDAYIVERTAGSAARYVGMLGSRRKQAVIWRALETAGIPADALARVKVPIGIDVGADTPAEIGVAVAAELIRDRRLAQAGE